MSEQQTFELPLGDEPKPWIVEVWVYGHMTPEPFVNREDAIEWGKWLGEGDGCAVHVRNPEGRDICPEIWPFLRPHE